MKNYSENRFNEKLTAHIQLKLSACLFMFLNNIREIKSQEEEFGAHEIPGDIKNIENMLIDTAKNIEDILNLPIESRKRHILEMNNAKATLTSVSESLFAYVSLNTLLSEIVIDFQRLRFLENEPEITVDFHQFLHDVTDFITKDENPELIPLNMSLMMKCFPLLMTKAKYNDYVVNSLKLLFNGENKSYISNAINLLKVKFLSLKLDKYGSYFPLLKSFFDSLLSLEFEKMTSDELDEVWESLDDNMNILDDLCDYLAIIQETLNFAILITTFLEDLGYLIDGNLVHKDAFYFALQTIKNGEDEALSENADEMYDNVLMGIIDAIIEDEKKDFLDMDIMQLKKYSETTIQIYEAASLITSIYYEMPLDIVYKANIGDEALEQADEGFVSKNIDDFLNYIATSLEGIPTKTSKLIKQIFFSSIPAPYTIDEFLNYADYVLDNTMNYTKKLRILDSVGMIFDTTGFIKELENNGGMDDDY